MKKIKVVSFANMPTHPARVFWPCAVAWLLLDRFHAPGWAFGCWATVFLLSFVAVFVGWLNQIEVELFEDGGSAKK